MRLARRALVAALVTLTLCAAASAQTLRNENDPRNIAPTVGTGGPPGGPTGLFTIYDGQTLRRGEYTFSVAYSNYDRDPGDADIVEVPVSFQVGLNDYLELFFNVDAYRGIRVNSPHHLSSFYLPNTRLLGNGGCSGAAIVAAPVGNVGTIAGTAVFRPQCTAPFVNYPFFGGNAGSFNQGGGTPGAFFGFPGFNAVIGNPVATGDGGHFGSADLFPGLGSPVGSILPGVVLATSFLPQNLVFGPNLRVPATFTIWPTYLPDAPFINREYGESSFNTLVFGAKIRFTEPDNALGVALIPFYRYYMDKADDANGFRNLQRGASPGGDIGDFGLVFAIDGRLSRSVNLSANFGYILNSNPKIGDAVILDRPDEFIAGVGFDFPINRHIQVITEVRSTQYVGGRTLNAFENSPVEVLAGLRIFPKRAWGFGAAYRYHLNQQNRDLFNPRQANTQVTPFNVTIAAPGPGFTTFTIPAQTVPATEGAFPRQFTPSEDANGFIFQFWVGNRDKRVESVLPNCPPTVTLNKPEPVKVPVPCKDCEKLEPSCPTATQVQLMATASDPENDPAGPDTLLYTWQLQGGKQVGEGKNITWDLTGQQPGTYTATVTVDDGCGCQTTAQTTVTLLACDCHPIPEPTVNVACPTQAAQGQPATFTANVSNLDPTLTPNYNWEVPCGTITSGQGTPTITVDCATCGSITATVTVTADNCPWRPTASCTTPCPAPCRVFDEPGPIMYNDEKARLDNYAIQLQNEPQTTGYIVAYRGSSGGRNIGWAGHPAVGDIPAEYRLSRAVDYLVRFRGIDRARLVCVIGGDRDLSTVEYILCPIGKKLEDMPDRASIRVTSCDLPFPYPLRSAGRATGRRSPGQRARRRGSRRTGR